MKKATLLTLLFGICVSPLGATEDDPFADPVNLRVLPKDISSEDLRRTMVGFSGALNAKCSYCHVGDDSRSPRDLDFPDDGKPTKRIAREMLKMVAQINRQVAAMDRPSDEELVEVTCITCHRGQHRPVLIRETLTAAREEGGAEAVIARYSELHERYFGNHTFDLRPSTLAGFARRMASEGDVEGGIEVLEFADRLFPNQSSVLFALARVHQQAGNAERAIELLVRVVELEPESEFYRRQLAIARDAVSE